MKTLIWCVVILSLEFAEPKWAPLRGRLRIGIREAAGISICKLIENRNPDIWKSGLVYGCTRGQRELQTDNQIALEFQFKLNVGQLPEDYPLQMSYDFRMWYLNRLLNGHHNSCAVSTGVGQSIDAMPSDKVSVYSPRDSIPDWASTVPRARYILIGPHDDSLCGKLEEKMFNRKRMYVSACELVEISGEPVDGFVLAKYYLNTTEFRCDLEPYEYHDVDPFFLHEMNLDKHGCAFNGYWGGVKNDYIFDYAVVDGNYDYDYDDEEEEELTMTKTDELTPTEADEVPSTEADKVPPTEADQVPLTQTEEVVLTKGEEVPPTEAEELPPAEIERQMPTQN